MTRHLRRGTDREVKPGSTAFISASPTAPVARPDHGAALALQRQAGNRAVSDLISRTDSQGTAAPPVQRLTKAEILAGFKNVPKSIKKGYRVGKTGGSKGSVSTAKMGWSAVKGLATDPKKSAGRLPSQAAFFGAMIPGMMTRAAKFAPDHARDAMHTAPAAGLGDDELRAADEGMWGRWKREARDAPDFSEGLAAMMGDREEDEEDLEEE